jgi:putative ATPase
VEQDYLPEEIKDKQFWFPQENAQEKKIREHLNAVKELKTKK